MAQEFWTYKNIRAVHLELSTLCNSICPWCPRYNNFSPNLNPNITEGSFSLQRFKDTFPKDFIKQLRTWTFAGDYGDPCTAKDIIPILEYIHDINPDCMWQINTNGGMKNVQFWKELGELFAKNKKRYVIFSVDGLDYTNHIYRRNVKLNKVMSAMEAYSATGATGIWEFLKFKHNEHQQEEAKQLADKLGFQIKFKNPNGFEGEAMPARDKDYNIEYKIYPAENKPIQPLSKQTIQFIDLINTGNIKYSDVKDRVETFYSDKKSCIHCHANHKFGGGYEVRINYDGTVWPCSFFGHLSKKYLQNRYVSRIHQLQAEDIFKNIKNDLNEMTLEEILDGDPFKGVYEKWDGNRILLCSDSCGQTNTMEKIYA